MGRIANLGQYFTVEHFACGGRSSKVSCDTGLYNLRVTLEFRRCALWLLGWEYVEFVEVEGIETHRLASMSSIPDKLQVVCDAFTPSSPQMSVL